MRNGFLVFIIVLVAAGSVSAVGAVSSPVHEAMRASMAVNSWRLEMSGANSGDDEFGDLLSTGSHDSGRKSVVRAALYSALIPGGGQYYLDRRRTARYFFTAEAATWIAYLSFHTYGNWRRDDYINYAAVHANAQLEGKSDDFLSWVGFYSSIREFNTLGRAFDPERSYLQDTPENHWEWHSDEERQTYRDLRNRSKDAYRKSDFMIGAAIVNRIVSLVDAVRSAVRMNRRIGHDALSSREDRRWHLKVDPLASKQLCLTIYPGF